MFSFSFTLRLRRPWVLRQLWALLPAYCARPLDLAASLASLEAPLAKAVKDVELQAVVCHSLRELSGDQAGGAINPYFSSVKFEF